MAKITKNPNEMIGAARLVPGRKAMHSRPTPKNELKMVSARIPQSLLDDLNEVLDNINADRRKVTKQDYFAEAIKRAVEKDKAAIAAGERLDY